MYAELVIPRVPPGTVARRIWLTVPTTPTFQLIAALTPPWADGATFRACLDTVVTSTSCMGDSLTALNAYLAKHPEIEALNGIAVWAKIGADCEGAGTIAAAVGEARQVLDLMVKSVEQQSTPRLSCAQALATRWRELPM